MEHEVILCDDPHCDNVAHRAAIDNMARSTLGALLEAGNPLSTRSKPGYCQVPGWNTYCKELHSIARDSYLLWRDHGRQRQGLLFDNMTKSRAQFKRALRQCKQDGINCKADSLATNLLRKDDKAFWKEIKKINDTGIPLASTINNVTGANAITAMWQNHFQKLLNSSSDVKSKEFVLQALGEKSKYCFERFTVANVMESISSVKCGKSAGKDGIYAEHFKYASDRVAVLLSILINTMFIHGYMPQMIMDTIIIPIVKDKKGNVTDGDNYRPVAITCVFSKILELLILNRYGHLLKTTCNQFGFKEKLGTDLCVYTLK
jgi:hypothetical protein